MKLRYYLKKKWKEWDSRRFSLIKTLYFNFHYLPWNQARKLPIHLRNVKLKNTNGKIIIDAKEIKYGMIKIGAKSRNFWCPNETSTLDLAGRGKLVFLGNCIMRRGTHIRLGKNAILEIGNSFSAASNCNIVCFYHVVFGENTHLGWDTTVMDTSWHRLKDVYSNQYMKLFTAVKVGANCWIGAKSSVLPGTKLPDNTIVSFGSVVNIRLKEQNMLLGGNPAKVIGEGYSLTEESFNGYPTVPKEQLLRRKSKYN
ncbi:MAG: acyltransferase [Paludibacteraceae bacterium]|nr:acyltransferase [Paludibacteraceae bacterium]